MTIEKLNTILESYRIADISLSFWAFMLGLVALGSISTWLVCSYWYGRRRYDDQFSPLDPLISDDTE